MGVRALDGSIPPPVWKKAGKKERQSLVQQEVRRTEDEAGQVKAVGMKKQGEWTNWEEVKQREIKWPQLFHMEQSRVSFLLRSVYDVLPSPTNLHTWGLIDDPNCRLCKRPANLEHVLSTCSVALADGRYTWGHDQVLSEIATVLDQERRSKENQGLSSAIHFIRSGEMPKTPVRAISGILRTEKDWAMEVDLMRQLKFPPETGHGLMVTKH